MSHGRSWFSSYFSLHLTSEKQGLFCSSLVPKFRHIIDTQEMPTSVVLTTRESGKPWDRHLRMCFGSIRSRACPLEIPAQLGVAHSSPDFWIALCLLPTWGTYQQTACQKNQKESLGTCRNPLPNNWPWAKGKFPLTPFPSLIFVRYSFWFMLLSWGWPLGGTLPVNNLMHMWIHTSISN